MSVTSTGACGTPRFESEQVHDTSLARKGKPTTGARVIVGRLKCLGFIGVTHKLLKAQTNEWRSGKTENMVKWRNVIAGTANPCSLRDGMKEDKRYRFGSMCMRHYTHKSGSMPDTYRE